MHILKLYMGLRSNELYTVKIKGEFMPQKKEKSSRKFRLILRLKFMLKKNQILCPNLCPKSMHGKGERGKINENLCKNT